jgi:hypothetical protein
MSSVSGQLVASFTRERIILLAGMGGCLLPGWLYLIDMVDGAPGMGGPLFFKDVFDVGHHDGQRYPRHPVVSERRPPQWAPDPPTAKNLAV